MDRVADLVTLVCVVLIAMTVASVRSAHSRVEYSIGWLGAALLLLILSRSETALVWLAGLLGIGDPPLALLLVAFCAFGVVLYRYSIVLSELKDASTALAQRVAILQHRLQSLHETGEPPSGG
jgi:hypothetical protein